MTKQSNAPRAVRARRGARQTERVPMVDARGTRGGGPGSGRSADGGSDAAIELSNRLFFRLYQCANMLHKTGSRAIEDDGLTTQQWAVMGALSRPQVTSGMAVGELAAYLMVSRQNLSGVVGRMEQAGHLVIRADDADRRTRRVRLSAAGRRVWEHDAQPKIRRYYGDVLDGFSINDMSHMLHYLLRLLEQMKRVDMQQTGLQPADGQGMDD